MVMAAGVRPLRPQGKAEAPSKNRNEVTIRQALSQACGVAIRPSQDSFIGHKGRKKRDKKKKVPMMGGNIGRQLTARDGRPSDEQSNRRSHNKAKSI